MSSHDQQQPPPAETQQWVRVVEVVSGSAASGDDQEMSSVRSSNRAINGEFADISGGGRCRRGQTGIVVLLTPHESATSEAENHALITGPVAMFLRSQDALRAGDDHTAVVECHLSIVAHVPPNAPAAVMEGAMNRCRTVATRIAHFAAKHHECVLVSDGTETAQQQQARVTANPMGGYGSRGESPVAAGTDGCATDGTMAAARDAAAAPSSRAAWSHRALKVAIDWSIDNDSRKPVDIAHRMVAAVGTTSDGLVAPRSGGPASPYHPLVMLALPSSPPWHIVGVPVTGWMRSAHDVALQAICATPCPHRFNLAIAVVKAGSTATPAAADQRSHHRSIAAPSHFLGCLDFTHVHAAMSDLSVTLANYAADGDSVVITGEAPLPSAADVAQMTAGEMHDRIKEKDHSAALMLSDCHKATLRHLEGLRKRSAASASPTPPPPTSAAPADPSQPHVSPTTMTPTVTVSTAVLHQHVSDVFSKIEPMRLAQRRCVIAMTQHYVRSRSSVWQSILGSWSPNVWDNAEVVLHSSSPPDIVLITM